jgi:hypothetical protein
MQDEAYKQSVEALKTYTSNSDENMPVSILAQICADALDYMKSEDGRNSLQHGTYFSHSLKEAFFDTISRPSELQRGGRPESVFFLGICLYAYLLERVLSKDTFGDLESRVISFFSAHLHELPTEYQTRFEIVKINVVANVERAKSEKGQNSVTDIGERYVSQLGAMVETIKGWDAKIDYWAGRATQLEDKTRSLAGELNFVGLAHAFKKMIGEKKSEKTTQIRMLSFLGLILALAPLLPLVIAKIFKIEELWSLHWIPFVMPVVVLELLLLYYFRIFVKNFYSIKAQLLQLELRYHVCAFIEGYVEFAEKNRKGNEDKLFEKFEALVFGPIAADMASIPTQFDGIEQIIKGFGALKK